MGCGQTKQDKKQLETKTSATSLHNRSADQNSRINSLFQQTEHIDSDYIIHRMDPLQTQRNYLRKGVSKSNSSNRIIRIYNCSNLDMERRQEFEESINLLLQLKHLNVQSTVATYYYDYKLYIVSEYLDGGNLLTQLDKFSQLQQYQMMDIFCQIMGGLQYLHEHGITHGDLRLEHLVFTSKSLDKIKIVDFCVSNKIKLQCSSWKPVNSMYELSFKSPEQLRLQLSMKSDIWACGCLLYFFLTSHMPFQANNLQSLKNAILRGVPSFDGTEWTTINPDMKELVQKMLHGNPQRRPSAKEVLNHPQFLNRTKIVNKLNRQLQKHMKEYKISSQLQTAILIYIAENLMSDQDKKKLMDEFQKFDLNKDGLLTKDELLKVYSETLPPERALKEVNEIFTKLDQNKSGKIDYQEFIVATIDQKKYFNKEKLSMLFQQIDRDHSGNLSKDELKKLLRDMQIPKEKYDQLTKQLDQNGDGEIAQEEFLAMMLQI